MNANTPRGVTRGYVIALCAAVAITAAALTVAAWGLLALALAVDPVSTEGVPRAAGPLLIAVALAALFGCLWRQAIALLRGRRTPSWGLVITAAVAPYAIWSIGGTFVGMDLADTWLSPFAALLVPVWGVCALLFWGMLVRRLFSEKGTPQWPWERTEGEQ